MKWELTEKHSRDHEPFDKTQSKDFLLSVKSHKRFQIMGFFAWTLLGEGQTRQSKHFLQSLRFPGYKVLQEGCISFPKNLLDRYTVLLPEEGRKQFSVHHWSTPTSTKPIPFRYHTRPKLTPKEQDFGKQTTQFPWFASQSELYFLLMVGHTVVLPEQTCCHSTKARVTVPGLAQDSPRRAGSRPPWHSTLAFESLHLHCFFQDMDL